MKKMSSPGVDASDAEGEKTGGAGTSRGSCDARGCSEAGVKKSASRVDAASELAGQDESSAGCGPGAGLKKSSRAELAVAASEGIGAESDDGDEPLKTSSTAELAAIFGAASATLGTASMKLLTACGLLLALSPMKLTTAPPPELG